MGFMRIDLSELDYKSIELEGVDTRDYPKFCDAFISEALWKNGTPLTEEELDILHEDHPELVYEKVMEHLF